MKSVRNTFILFVSVIFLNSHVVVAMNTITPLYGPGFEVVNKATNQTTFVLFVDGNIKKHETVSSGGKFDYNVLKELRPNQRMQLGVYNNGLGQRSLSGSSISNITPKPDFMYEFNAPNRTHYVTWNPAQSPSLYPQPSSIFGKSDSGWVLVNNLKQDQIIKK